MKNQYFSSFNLYSSIKMENASHKKEFDELLKRKDIIPFSVLNTFFDSLASVSLDEMKGEWQGGYFKTGRLIDLTLKDYGIWKWTGKKFDSPFHVEALRHNFMGIKFNFPILGLAQLRMVDYREVNSAAMIYQYLPVIDHFRKIDETTILGAMDVKGTLILYFYLYKD